MNLATIFSVLLALIRIVPDIWSVVTEDSTAADTKEALIAGLASRHKDIVIRALEARHNTSDTDDEHDRSKQ